MEKNCILLVEDSPDDEELTLHALSESRVGNPVVVAHDGAEALDYLAGCRGCGGKPLPALILLDINLPKVDGLAVLRQIRADERTRLLPVVILTGSKGEQAIIESYRLGANSYVRKPGDFAQFTEAVKQLGLYWLLINQGPPVGAQ